MTQYNTGDLLNAEKSLINLESNLSLTYEQLTAIYNNLGVISLSLGNYSQALNYNTKAEALVKERQSKELADIFNNRGYIYHIMKSNDLAKEYLEKSIRVYKEVSSSGIDVYWQLSSAYINISIVFIETKKYDLALKYLQQNVDLKTKFKLPELFLSYLNIAKLYVKLGNNIKAEEFYLKSIQNIISEHNENYYRLAEVYFDYGLLKSKELEINKAIIAHQEALSICLKNYGHKHTLVALAYNHLGDDWLKLNKIDSSIYYYQQSLIAVSRNFNDTSIFSNPPIDSALFDIRLLDNLKSKARALELYAALQSNEASKEKLMATGLSTIELAIQLIERIRNNYLSEESRIYLAENEKETYIFAVHLACSLYNATHNEAYGHKMYVIALRAKAAVLRNEITGNELFYTSGVPDSLREKRNRLTGNSAAYNNMIIEESRKMQPDTNKIAFWKDALFTMNREKEKVSEEIDRNYPEYHNLIMKTEPLPEKSVRNLLKKGEVIIDYLLSNQYNNGKRQLYVFVLSHDNMKFNELWLDSAFIKNAGIIRSTGNTVAGESQHDKFVHYTAALNYMYQNLIKPVENEISGDRLIIIPDEEIGWLPFDAFLRSLPQSGQTGYEGLGYLINDYTFSYAYSASLLKNDESRHFGKTRVFAFSPAYGQTVGEMKLTGLESATEETRSIFELFPGEDLKGSEATRTNFLSRIESPAIMHLAMHSVTDSVDSKYSYLAFDPDKGSEEPGRLYNYEISLTNMRSPMVVLSACNSGTGTLYYGEGLMSLARSFTLAGASSVIKTSWVLNDEASAKIIRQFYKYLAKGKEKNESMRLAKLDYIKNSPPAFQDPYFWAAYEVTGDNSPVVRSFPAYAILIIIGMIILTGAAVFYFRRRRISSDLSR